MVKTYFDIIMENFLQDNKGVNKQLDKKSKLQILESQLKRLEQNKEILSKQIEEEKKKKKCEHDWVYIGSGNHTELLGISYDFNRTINNFYLVRRCTKCGTTQKSLKLAPTWPEEKNE